MQRLLLVLVATLATAGLAQAEDTIKKIKDSGSVTLGVRESSGVLSYTLGGAKYVGYHVAICEKAVEDLEKVVGRKIAIKYQPVTSQNRIPLVQNGTVDLECGSTTNNATRQKDVSFANTTFVEEVRMVVKTGSTIKSVADLQGKTVATTTGTTSVQTLRKNKRAENLDFKEVFGKDHADSFLLVDSGRADVFVMDGSLLAGLVARSKNPADFKIVGEVLSVEPIAIMMRKDDDALKKSVNATIASMVKSGENQRALRQVVHAADAAHRREGRPRDERQPQGGAEEPQRQADGRLREEVVATRARPAATAAGLEPDGSPWVTRAHRLTGPGPGAAQEREGPVANWDWQVFCKNTLDGEVMPRCFGSGGDITYLDWLISNAWGWTLVGRPAGADGGAGGRLA